MKIFIYSTKTKSFSEKDFSELDDLKIGLIIEGSVTPAKDPRVGKMPHYTSRDRLRDNEQNIGIIDSENIRKNLKHYKTYDFYDERSDMDEITQWKSNWEKKDNVKYQYVFFNGKHWSFYF